jgi:hypothetical protein
MSNHNKKRNVGLIYEQLIRYASKCILEGKQEKAEIAMQILKEHFKVGTELYKEFRLFNALVQTTVPTESFAFRVLSEAKDASRKHDTAKLDYEKGALIRSINKRLDFPGFFDIKIPEYRKLATVQTLLNEWRKSDDSVVNIERINYESKVAAFLTEDHVVTAPMTIKSDVSSLSLRLMQEKLVRKYSDTLNSEQIKLINVFVKSNVRKDFKELRESCQIIKDQAINAVSKLRFENERTISEKVDPVVKEIRGLSITDVNEPELSRYLTLLKLIDEARNSEKENVK